MATTESFEGKHANAEAKTKIEIEWKVQHNNFASLTADEKGQLGKLFTKVFHSQFEECVSSQDEVFWISVGDSNRIVSMALLDPHFAIDQLKYEFFSSSSTSSTPIEAADVTYLSSVGTLSEYRRQGCTSAILQAVLDYHHKFKLSKSSSPIFLEVSAQAPDAMRLYRNTGFDFPSQLSHQSQNIDELGSKIPDDCKTIFEGETFYLMSIKV